MSEQMVIESDAEDLLSGLNEAQTRAVTIEKKPLAILAGPGSGKTRVLTRRIGWRALSGLEDPRRVLALTFTRKAAGELRLRLHKLGLRDQIAAGTFHSVAYSQLKNFWRDRNQQEPELLDRKVPVITQLLPRDNRSRDTFSVVAEIDWARARGIRPEIYVQEADSHGRIPPLPPTTIARIFQEYEEFKIERGLIDFDDLLEKCIQILGNNQRFKSAQEWRFRHFYVDEFQDVNPLQFTLLKAWLSNRPDLCVVGDPNQAIYSWNGAKADYLLEFANYFDNTETVKLNQNYRSTPQILSAAASILINQNSMDSFRLGGDNPTLFRYDDDEQEALGIARRAREVRSSNSRWSSQAVLVRTNAQTSLIVDTLRNAGIPAKARSGSGLLDRPDVQSILKELSKGSQSLSEKIHDLTTSQKVDEPEKDTNTEQYVAFAELRNLSKEYLTLDPDGSGKGFNTWLRSLTHTDDSTSSDSIEVATFHASKGLEWSVVHVAGLERGFVPISHAQSEEAINEERRLLYVALTRARDLLHCSWAAKRQFGERLSDRDPSPWVEDLSRSIKMLNQPLNPDEQNARIQSIREQAGITGTLVSPQLVKFKNWRKVTARAADVPEHVVLDDATLEALLQNRPCTHTDLLEIPGIGPVKAKLYGTAILKILSELD